MAKQRYYVEARYRDSQGRLHAMESASCYVYKGGTQTLATIYSNETGTVKSNPFTLSTDGIESFYADNNDYDLKLTKTGCDTIYCHDIQIHTLIFKNFLFSGIDSFSISASVIDKSCTVRLRTIDGAKLSSHAAAQISFRNSPLTDGSFTVREITEEKAVTLSSGSTLGFTAAEKGRIYIWAFDDSGTVHIGVSRTADIFSEANLVSTTAEGAAGGADSAATIYTTSALTSVPCRLLGYIEIQTGAVAGEWDNAPTKIQLYGPGIRKTGDTIQEKITESGAVTTGTTIINLDDSIPQQSAEGTKFLEQAITPTYDHSIFEVEVGAIVSPSLAAYLIGALFIDSVEDALKVDYQYGAAADDTKELKIVARYTNQNTDSKTFKFHAGLQTAGTITFNGHNTARKFGGILASYIKVRELEP